MDAANDDLPQPEQPDVASQTDPFHNIPILYERPPIHINRNGVHYINPADIFRSRLGREGLARAAEFARKYVRPNSPRE